MGVIRKEGNTLKKVTTPVERRSNSLVSIQNQINNITRYEFTATDLQEDFVCAGDLILPIVFIDGSIQGSDVYSYTEDTVTITDGVVEGSNVQIVNLR